MYYRLAGERRVLNDTMDLHQDDSDDRRDLIAEAIEELDEPFRSVVEMRFYGRLKFREIAELLEEEYGWKDRRWAAVYWRRGLNKLAPRVRHLLQKRGSQKPSK